MASREEPQVDETRGLPDVPAPQETLFEEDPTPPDTAEAPAAPERNGDASSPTTQSVDIVSPARPRGMASFPGGPPPVTTPPPTVPLFTQAEPPSATPSFRVTTVESTAAFRPAGPPPPAPALTQTPPALAAEPEAEVEEAEVEEAEVEEAEVQVAALGERDTAEAEAPVEAETPAEVETPAVEVEQPVEVETPAVMEAPVEVEPPATAEPAGAAVEAEVETPPAKPARRTRSGRAAKARQRAEATTAEPTATGAAGPAAAAAEEPVVETAAQVAATAQAATAQAPATAPESAEAEAEAGEPSRDEAVRPATRSRRRRGRSARATAQADGETAEGQAATPPAAAGPEPVPAAGPEAAEEPTRTVASSDGGQGADTAPVATETAEIQAEGEEGASDAEGGSARTRARRRRRAAAKARLKGGQTVEAADTAEGGDTSGPASAQPAGTRPAPARTERPAAERQQGAVVRGPGRQRGGASAATGASPAPAASAAPAPATGAAPAPAATAGADEATPAKSRGRGRRRVASRPQGEAAAAPAVAEPTPARTAAPVERSTRLEASRARGARQGQAADRGRRRRRGGLTEDQKRVLREGPERKMLVTEGAERTQIGVIEGRTLVEHYVTRKTGRSMVGNIYLGRVQNVLPGMEAAFVDIGKGRNAVLYAGEVNYNEEDLDGEAPRIEKALKPGQAILVQVTKDPIGAKGARLTTQVSLAGRYLVLQPEDSTFGISRRLPEAERARLREILKEVRPKGLGLIVRTAAEGASADDLRADLTRLQARWETIERKAKKASPPAVIYQEPELVVRVIRDIFSPDFIELVVDAPGLYERVKTYLEEVAPDLLPKVKAHDGRLALFEQYRVTEQIHKALERKVWLPSGGSLVIDQTEAMTVVDVNTGKYVGKSNLEETVVATNLEAAEEIVRQLRLRDIGGIIIIDFIDMLFEKNQQAVVERLRSALARDKTKSQVMEVSSLGLVQMTRKRVSGGLLDSFSETCPACEGRGVVITHEV